MDSIIRGTNATVQIKIKEDIDFSTITALELHIYQPTHPIVKTLEDLTLDAENQTVTYELPQSERLYLAIRSSYCQQCTYCQIHQKGIKQRQDNHGRNVQRQSIWYRFAMIVN